MNTGLNTNNNNNKGNNTMEPTKKILLSSSFNSEETAYGLELTWNHLSSRNAMQKFTARKHWIETNKKGENRYCYASFNSKTNAWTVPKKGTYSTFKAMRQYTDEHGNEDIITTGFGYYATSEEAEEFQSKYILDSKQFEYVNKYIKCLSKAEKLHKEFKEEQTIKIKESKRGLETYQFDILYKENEINKCTSDMELVKICISGYGVKKRCRKEDYFNIKLGFYMAKPDADLDELKVTYLLAQNPLAYETLDRAFRSVRNAKIGTKKVTYDCPKGDSPFYGMKENLFSENGEKHLELYINGERL